MKTRKLLVAAAILVAGSFALSSCGNSSNSKTHNHEEHNSTEVKNDVKSDEIVEATYQCPMKCEGDKTYDKEGNCPVCKMALKEVK